MYNRIKTFIDSMANVTTTDRLNRAKAAVHLVTTSAQFATQK